MEFRERVLWREEPEALPGEMGVPRGPDEPLVVAICCHGRVAVYQFVDEEHGERDAQADKIGESGESGCRWAHFVDEEHEEE